MSVNKPNRGTQVHPHMLRYTDEKTLIYTHYITHLCSGDVAK